MTPEQQRIAIAEACGHINPRRTASGPFIASTHKNDDGKEWGTHGIPDYLNDLNAMHEAEKVMNPGEQFYYSSILIRILGHEENGLVELSDFDLLNATAAQRAESFLRTIGKWEEQP